MVALTYMLSVEGAMIDQKGVRKMIRLLVEKRGQYEWSGAAEDCSIVDMKNLINDTENSVSNIRRAEELSDWGEVYEFTIAPPKGKEVKELWAEVSEG